MGNITTAGKRFKEAQYYGDIYIQLNQESFTPGDTLTGTIFINLKEPYPGDKLCLKMKGAEVTHCINKEARQGQKESKSKRIIIKNTVGVFDWSYDTCMPPGQFTIPISFKIPDGIPGSFFFRQGGTGGEIRYRLEAFLKPESIEFPKIKHKMDLVIKENSQREHKTTDAILIKAIKSCGYINQGTIIIKTSLDKNAYAPTEEMRISCEIDNSMCKTGIKEIVFELIQTIVLCIGDYTKNFSYTINRARIGYIGAGKIYAGEQQKHAIMILPPGQLGVIAKPSQNMIPSAHGDLIKSDFFLRVRCLMKGCTCCGADLAADLPVQIYAPLIPKQPTPAFPTSWFPQPIPTINLCINNAVLSQPKNNQQPQFIAQPIQTSGQLEIMKMMDIPMPQQI